MTVLQFKKRAAQAAREIRLLSPYTMGRALRFWYLRKLYAHHVASAEYQFALAQEHAANAEYWAAMAGVTAAALAEYVVAHAKE